MRRPRPLALASRPVPLACVCATTFITPAAYLGLPCLCAVCVLLVQPRAASSVPVALLNNIRQLLLRHLQRDLQLYMERMAVQVCMQAGVPARPQPPLLQSHNPAPSWLCQEMPCGRT